MQVAIGGAWRSNPARGGAWRNAAGVGNQVPHGISPRGESLGGIPFVVEKNSDASLSATACTASPFSDAVTSSILRSAFVHAFDADEVSSRFSRYRRLACVIASPSRRFRVDLRKTSSAAVFYVARVVPMYKRDPRPLHFCRPGPTTEDRMPPTSHENKTLIMVAIAAAVAAILHLRGEAAVIVDRPVTVTWDLGEGGERSVSGTDTRRLRLSGGKVFVAVETARSEYAWEGRFAGAAVDGNGDEGDAHHSGRLIEIPTDFGPVTVAWLPDGRCVQRVPIDAGGFRIIELPNDDFGCGVLQPPHDAGAEDAPARFSGGCDDGSTLDVLIKWTPTARIEAGGEVSIRAIADASVAISNHVYATSGIDVRMRAVGISETEAYDQDASANVIGHLQTIGDGLLDSVHAERDALGADLVALLQGTSPFYCGVAYLVGSPVPELGFSCTVWSCALGNLTFTHEIGHNQGCCHAPGDGGGCTTGGVFPYSTGHRFQGTSGTLWRTVMAYAPGNRWPRLSNPEILHDGTPTGLPGEFGADNARTIRETAAVMANFRCAVVPDDGSMIHLVSPTLVPPAGGEQIGFTIEDLPLADPGSMVWVEAFAVADLDAANEYFSVRFGKVEVGVLFDAVGEDCLASVDGLEVSAEIFNDALQDGTLTTTIVASSAIDSFCAASELRVTARYMATDDPCGIADTDGDGTPDGCDACPGDPEKIDPGVCGCSVSETDSDGDGTPDCVDGCPFDPKSTDSEDCDCGSGDIDGDGDVDIDDIIEVIIAWNGTGDLPADCNGDGLVDGGDLSIVLGAFGGCG